MTRPSPSECDHPFPYLVLVGGMGRDPEANYYLIHCNKCVLDFGEPIQVGGRVR